MTIFLLVVMALAGFGVLMEIAYSLGHSRGYAKGMDEAAGWRDNVIKERGAMIEEALRQRDEARAQRHNAPPNPFASKDLN